MNKTTARRIVDFLNNNWVFIALGICCAGLSGAWALLAVENFINNNGHFVFLSFLCIAVVCAIWAGITYNTWETRKKTKQSNEEYVVTGIINPLLALAGWFLVWWLYSY